MEVFVITWFLEMQRIAMINQMEFFNGQTGYQILVFKANNHGFLKLVCLDLVQKYKFNIHTHWNVLLQGTKPVD